MLRRAFLSLSAMIPALFVRTLESAEPSIDPKPAESLPTSKPVGYLWSEIPERFQKAGVWSCLPMGSDLCVDNIWVGPEIDVRFGTREPLNRADFRFLVRWCSFRYDWLHDRKSRGDEPASGWQNSVADCQYAVVLDPCWKVSMRREPNSGRPDIVVQNSKQVMVLNVHRVTKHCPLPHYGSVAIVEMFSDYLDARFHASQKLASLIGEEIGSVEYLRLVGLAVEHGLYCEDQMFEEAVALRQAYLCKA